MGCPLLNDVLVLATTDSLKAQKSDGSMGSEPWSPMVIDTWSICHNELQDNPHHKSDTVLDAIVRLGDYNQRQFDHEKGFMDNVTGWDEWRTFSWMEAVERIAGEIDGGRFKSWRDTFVRFGEHVLADCKDMEHFDGAIPNHGIWNHALLYRIGQNYDRQDFVEMADLAFERILANQTPDGCIREGGTIAGFPGSPVLMYNIVSMMAINMYYGYSGNVQAQEVLEKGFHWWWHTIFPDFSHIPAFDCRNHSNVQSYDDDGPVVRPLNVPAYFFNKPMVRAYAEDGWRIRRDAPYTDVRQSPHTGPYHSQALGFVTLQWDKIHPTVDHADPQWPELKRFTGFEGGVRRRNGWHVGMCGINNTTSSSVVLPTWRLERQSLIDIWHESCGFIVGNGNSLIQEKASTMTFYENGVAHYMHSDAYFKTTPALDTLHLRYGGNTGAVSVDSSRRDVCEVTFSMLGEKGKRPERGTGHPVSAMAARGRLPLALAEGRTVNLDERSWTLSNGEGVCVRIEAGEKLDCGSWTLCCPDASWKFLWPIELSNPYNPLHSDTVVGSAEVVLWTESTTKQPRPNATFIIEISCLT